MKARKIVSGLLALFLTLQLPMAAMAQTGAVSYNDGQQHVINDDVEAQPSDFVAVAANGENTVVVVNGDVIGEFRGVQAQDGEVIVEGDVTAGSQGIFTMGNNGATIEVGGDVTVTARTPDEEAHAVNVIGANSQVTVGGDVSATGNEHVNGVVAVGSGSEIEVGGSVESHGDRDSAGVLVRGDNISVTVDDDVSADEYAVYIRGSDADVQVGGDINGGEIAVVVESNATLTVGGDVNAEDNRALGILVSGENAEITVDGSVNATSENMGVGQGIYVEGSSNTIVIGEEINASGNAADALDIIGANNNVSVSGDVVATITDADEYSVGTGVVIGEGYDLAADGNTVTVGGGIKVENIEGSEAQGVTIFGNENTVTIGEDVSVSSNEYAVAVFEDGEDNTIIIGGNVVSTGDGVVLIGENANVTVSGSIQANDFGVLSYDATVVVQGDIDAGIGINADRSEVTAQNIIASDTGIFAGDNAVVHVQNVQYGADFDSENDYEPIGIAMQSTADVLVDRSVVNEFGAATGLVIEIFVKEEAGSIRVNETLDCGENGMIGINNSANLTESEIVDYIPEITVHEIVGAENFLRMENIPEEGEATSVSKDVVEQVYKKIEYIVWTNDMENGKLTVQGCTTLPDGTLVAHEDEIITINIVADSGYEVKEVSGGRAYVKKEADGSYTLNIPRGGGVDISAVLGAIVNPPAPDPTPDPIPDPTPNPIPDSQPENNGNNGNKGNANTANIVVNVNSDKQAVTLYNKINTQTDAIAMVDTVGGKTLHRDAMIMNEGSKFNDVPKDVEAIVRAMDSGDLSAAPIQFIEAVKPFGKTVRVKAKNETQVTLYATRTLKNPSVIFYDIKTGEWIVLDVTIDPATGLLVLTVPGSGIMQVVEG